MTAEILEGYIEDVRNAAQIIVLRFVNALQPPFDGDGGNAGKCGKSFCVYVLIFHRVCETLGK